MATVNFSVPEEVKQAFNRIFKGENKSAVLARLMRQAVDERRRQKRRALVVARLQPEIAGEAIDVLDAVEFPVASGAALYERAAVLAASLGQHVFDTLYHAVALEHAGHLISADRRYYGKARRLGRIIYLADWDAGRHATDG